MELSQGANKWYKMFSVWAFAAVAALPELMVAASNAGLIQEGEQPQALTTAVKIVAFLGIAGRLVKQKSVEGAAPKAE